jgi:excisionase family DNA binding protein
MNNQLLVSEVAKVLGVCVDTVRNLDRKGVIKSRRDYKNHRVFDRAEVEELKRRREKLS